MIQRIILYLFVALAVAFAPTASAHTATQFFLTKVTNLPKNGPAKSVRFNLELQNLFEESLSFQIVHSRVFKAGESYSRKSRPTRSEIYTVQGRDKKRIRVRFQLSNDGKYQVVMKLNVFSGDKKVKLSWQQIDLYFRVQKGVYSVSSYEELYLPKVKKSEPGKPAPVVSVTGKLPMSASVVPLPDDIRHVFGEYNLPKRALPRQRPRTSSPNRSKQTRGKSIDRND